MLCSASVNQILDFLKPAITDGKRNRMCLRVCLLVSVRSPEFSQDVYVLNKYYQLDRTKTNE